MTVTKVGGANMIAHAQWPLCPPFPRVAVFYFTPESIRPYNVSCITTNTPFLEQCIYLESACLDVAEYKFHNFMMQMSKNDRYPS